MTLHSDPTREFYERCNATELYQLCVRVGLVVSPAMPREKLVSYLLGDEEPPRKEHPIHAWRNGLIGLIEDYWTGIEAQLRCPAKELGPSAKEGDPPKPDPSNYKSPIACYRCIDTRVISCLVENRSHEGLIQLHRKMTIPSEKDTNMGMTMGVLTLDNAPRTMEGMSAGDGVGRGPLKRLYDNLVEAGAAPRDEASTVAFVDADVDVRRQLVVKYLAVYDQMRGKSQGTVLPAATPVNEPAPAATPEPKRTPRNGGKRAAAEVSVEDGAPDNVGEAIVQHLTFIREGLGGAKLMLESLGAQGAKHGSSQEELLSAVRSLEKTIKTAAAITLWQIESQTDTPPSKVLAEANVYITILERALAGGKAS